MNDVTIYHNPACGTSRNTLAILVHAGINPTIIEYLKNPPTKERLKELISQMNISIRDLLRQKGTPYAELHLELPKWSDDELINFMMEYPILINRPIVVTELGVKLCRPSEKVLDILPLGKIESFTKEDGEIVSDSGKRDIKYFVL
jgi:arsenate reductase (glutaredoxin)